MAYINPEIGKEYRRKWRLAHPQAVREASRKYRMHPEGRVRAMLASIRRNAKVRGFEFSLDVDDLLPAMRNGRCQVTGIKFDMQARGLTPYSPSIDRINNSRGYTKDNVLLVIFGYNAAKGTGTHADVMAIARALIDAAAARISSKLTLP